MQTEYLKSWDHTLAVIRSSCFEPLTTETSWCQTRLCCPSHTYTRVACEMTGGPDCGYEKPTIKMDFGVCTETRPSCEYSQGPWPGVIPGKSDNTEIRLMQTTDTEQDCAGTPPLNTKGENAKWVSSLVKFYHLNYHRECIDLYMPYSQKECDLVIRIKT